MARQIVVLELQDVFFQRGDASVLEEVSISFFDGSSTLFIGPNGGGKTTLLKIILGLLHPTRGVIIRSFGSVGYVPQSFHFDRDFPITVLEFVLMGALSRLSWFGKFPQCVYRRAGDLLESLEISRLSRKGIGELSGGEMQKVLLARALMPDPILLVLDEPTAGLDQESSKGICSYLKELKGKKTMLMVTHSVEEMTQLCDRLVCVNLRVSILSSDDLLCSHYSFGVYH